MSLLSKYNKFLEHRGIEFKQHQFEGVSWCVSRETGESPVHSVRGGFIADEMGLGKTIMTIGLIVVNFLDYRCTLVVVPSILLEQWALEIYRTTGHRVLVYHGSRKSKIGVEQLQRAPIVLTTYGIISSKKPSLLHQVKWDRLVFDEAHHLRNRNTRFYAAKSLVSRSRWLISGTPVQNTLKDYHNMCNMLGLHASFYALEDNRSIIIEQFILRRTKAQVGIKMPGVVVNTHMVSWKNPVELNFAKDVHFACHGKSHLKMMMYARQTCIWPALLSSKLNGLINDSLLLPDHFMTDAVNHSSKLDMVLSHVVERKGNGCGKIIFCHFREEINEVHSRLTRAGFENILIFDSRNSLAKRMKLLRETQVDVIIVQIKTGCEGLNLQAGFSEIYFVSPNWNPSIQDQAIARCHRIGQLKDVHVFHYTMDSFVDNGRTCISMDQYIDSLHVVKREIISQIVK